MTVPTFATQVLRRLDPERAHGLALAALSLGLAGRAPASDDAGLGVRAMGLAFANPIGIAAGFDKDARVMRPLARLGFGFVEAGTVTPRPQPGNPKPRLFRLPEEGAVINRMGFNNDGLDAFEARLRRLRAGPPLGVPLGANLGINKDGADPPLDYAHGVQRLASLADYLVINLSSPNTPGLRDLQRVERLGTLLDAVVSARGPLRTPLLVKLAPDLETASLGGIVETAIAAGIDGLIVSNTLLARPPTLAGRHAGESGGLSGRPLRARATEMLAEISRLSAGRLTLIGSGGIETGADVLARLRAGADLVQVYTSFAYDGPGLLCRLKRELRQALRDGGLASLDAVRPSRP